MTHSCNVNPMSRNQDDLELQVDEAHMKALGLSYHIIEYVNAYKALSVQVDYAGKRRLRYGNLLIMVQELGKLMRLLKDCERAITEKDPFVRIPGYYSKEGVGGQSAIDAILREANKSQLLFMSVKKMLGRQPSNIDFTKFYDVLSKSENEIPVLIREMLFYDIDSDGVDERIPDDGSMDMLMVAVELNARGAADFITEWARAKELGLEFRLRMVEPSSGESGLKDRRYFVKEPVAQGK
jgi:hypothetical protein